MSTSRYHHGAVRAATLAAARGLLERMPADKISVRELARASGVSHAAPYRHFGDRDDFLLALTAVCPEEFVARQQAAFDVAPPGRRLLAVGTAYVDFAVAHPHVFQLVYSRRAPGDDPHLDEAVTQHVGLLRAAVADAVEAGALTADAERADVESAVWSLAHGLAHLAASGFLTCEQAPAILAALLGGGDRAA